MIERVEMWKYRGTLYKDSGQVEEKIENEIGFLIDKIPTVLSPKERLAVLETIKSYADEFQYALGNLLELREKVKELASE